MKIIGTEFVNKLGEMISFKFTNQFHVAGVDVLYRFMSLWGHKMFQNKKIKVMLFKGNRT